jgi:transposase-like protein
VRPDGSKEALGLWIEQTEGAKFWLRVLNELRTRGVNDMLIAVVDGLNGFPEAINASFPQAQVQTCIVHLLRHALSFASWKDRRELAAALRPIYTAVNAEVARAALEDFAAGPWGGKYPAVAPAWRRQWEQVIAFFAYPPEVRRIIYTTNAIESLNSKLRTAVRSRGHFPNGWDCIASLAMTNGHAPNSAPLIAGTTASFAESASAHPTCPRRSGTPARRDRSAPPDSPPGTRTHPTSE